MALPAFQHWRAACPVARVTVLAKPSVAGLWPLVEGVDAIVRLPPGRAAQRGVIRALRALDCDMALLLPHTFRAGWIAWRARIPLRRGTAGQFRGWMINDPVSLRDGARRHQQYEIFKLFGIEPSDPPPAPRLTIPRAALLAAAAQAGIDPSRPSIAILPGAARGESKRWPSSHFIAAARQVAERRPGARFVVCGTPAEADVCRTVCAGLGEKAIDLSGRTDLAGLAAILAQCAAVCCNDSGGMHLATAVGAPVVAVFGLTDPARTGPLGRARVIAPPGVKGSRAIARHSPAAARALASIPPERVAEALLEAVPP